VAEAPRDYIAHASFVLGVLFVNWKALSLNSRSLRARLARTFLKLYLPPFNENIGVFPDHSPLFKKGANVVSARQKKR
jgi:hypothetical protein